eukprot:symbB.v1.2.036747.t1/scaffold5255.1/size29345/1
MAKSTHLVMDFQDIAWYMSAVYFKTPEMTSFFSQHEHFEYSQLSVETFAFATDDDWEIDYHRRELIRHHKTLRSQLFKISGSKCPISIDDLESTRTTFLEMKNGTKKVEKDDWRAVSGPEKRFDKQWKGRTVFKIKAGAALPAEELPHVKSSSKPARISDPSDEVKPEHSSPEEKSGKSKPSSAPAEESKSGSSSSGLKRRLGRKTTSPSEYDDFGKEFIGELEKELDMELDKSDDVRKRRPKGDDVDYSPSSDDERWEKAKNKPGNESLEPRRISVPLPGSEAQALTPAYRKMIKRLDDKVELYKLHVKHYHMSPTQFRRHTSMLNLPERIYEKFEDVFNKCRVCSMSVAPPPRAKISGIRASVFGDVVFVDHCEIELKKKKYVVLLVLDGATNLLWATAQNSLDKKETLTHLRSWNEQNNCIPKAIVGDEAFFSDEFLEYYKFHGIKDLPCGPRTPWPNRAETADDDRDFDMDDPHLNPPPGGQPPFPPHPPPSMPPSTPEVQFPTAQPSPFSNPDETIEAVMQPVPDDSSSEEPHITEPERLETKQRHVSHDSDEKPPKAKARVMTKKQKVQLPGHQNPIEVPTVKPPNDDEDDVPNPTAASSNDPTIPLPTTTPHSFTPAQPEEEEEYNTPQSSQDTIPYQDVETEEPIITEDEVEHLNSNGSDDTQPYDSEFVQFEGDYFVNLGHNSAAPVF